MLPMWRHSWRIFTSFLHLLRSVDKHLRLLILVTSIAIRHRTSYYNLDMLRLGKLFVMRFERRCWCRCFLHHDDDFRLLQHDDDLPKDFLFAPRFTRVDSCSFWKQCVDFFNLLVCEEPTDLRMRIPPPTTKFDGLDVSLTENRRKAAVQAPRQKTTNTRDLKD
jgi:hypothetical protein